MSNLAQLREQLRPHGIISPSCYQCHFFHLCGGIQPEQSLLNCFDLCLSDCSTCDNVCPHNQPDFSERLCEIGGLQCNNAPPVNQEHVQLPLYVPMIYHGSRRFEPLETEFVAIDPYQLLRTDENECRLIVNSPKQLRERFMLAETTRVILRGTAPDDKLEKYWAYRRRDHLADKLAQLDIVLAIAPNFSHFLGVPRTDNLFNRKRQLICLGEFENAGLSPVPHLNCVTQADWHFWKDYLLKNSNLTYVAVEFQTGNRNERQGKQAIAHLVWLQDQILRSLHPIIIGGAQFLATAAANFDTFTLIDSKPFMNAVHRRAIDCKSGKPTWTPRHTLRGFPIDDLLVDNTEKYSSWIQTQYMKSKNGPRRNLKPAIFNFVSQITPHSQPNQDKYSLTTNDL